MNRKNAMPDMSISPITQEKLDEQDKNKNKTQGEMFVNPNVKLDIAEKPQKKVLPTIPEEPKQELPEGFAKPKKPKKKLTEKQLAGLAKGRETSMKNRMAKAKAVKAEKAVKSVSLVEPPKFRYKEPEEVKHEMGRGVAQPDRPIYQQPDIDYDRIINGVMTAQEKKKQAKLDAQRKEEEVNNNVIEFEKQIRLNEREKIKQEYLDKLAEQKKVKAKETTEKIYNREPVNTNPYAYAFNLNSRNRQSRY
tara:strand:- start:1308 stop:2054 length:747 start_codon:yes stop_codon:yes gene_type:complete